MTTACVSYLSTCKKKQPELKQVHITMYVFSVRAVRGVHVLDEHVHGHDFMNHKIIHAKSTSKIKNKNIYQ